MILHYGYPFPPPLLPFPPLIYKTAWCNLITYTCLLPFNYTNLGDFRVKVPCQISDIRVKPQ